MQSEKGNGRKIWNCNIDEILLTSPLSKENARFLLSSDELRESLLMEYVYFNVDGNNHIYIEWIESNIQSNRNIVLEHIFSMANYISYMSETLVLRSLNLLRSRSGYFAKLACLDCIINNRGAIPEDTYITLNQQAYQHSRNIIVKFQAYINMLFFKENYQLYLSRIKRILLLTDYPTLFYRLANQIDLLPEQEKVKEVILEVISKKYFSEGVLIEITDRIS
jgi:hypothetical protein